MLIKANFLFPWGYTEVRYLERVPTVDSTIRSQGTTWVVTEVGSDETGGYRVTVTGKTSRSEGAVRIAAEEPD